MGKIIILLLICSFAFSMPVPSFKTEEESTEALGGGAKRITGGTEMSDGLKQAYDRGWRPSEREEMVLMVIGIACFAIAIAMM